MRKYNLTHYQWIALQYLKPPENLSVSEWAEKYRVLDLKTSAAPGPWRNEKTPYLIGVMNELLTYETEEIVFCKCTQVGGTEALQNMVGYIIQQDPSPSMIVYPTDKLAESISKNRLIPMFKASRSLKEKYRDVHSNVLELQFDGMYLTLAGSNSPSSLASKAIKYLMLDEVDKYPGATKKEADPISLAKERTKTFRNRKIYMTSTPTLRTGHIWRELQNCNIEKHYFVPCPHCGEMIELKFKQIQFPSGENLTNADRADMAVYCCQECGCQITDADKDSMLQRGEWRAVRDDKKSRKMVGYWINTLYSPFVRFSEIVKEFLDSKDDPEKLQNFVNSWLAEPWEDTESNVTDDIVMARQTECPEGIVPDWAQMLTAGVDVQKDMLYWSIRAWGPYLTSQNILHGKAFRFDEIEAVMNAEYFKANGDQMLVELCLIDSGYNADTTYEFCLLNSDWAKPVKGSSWGMMSNFRISRIDSVKGQNIGIDLVMVDGGKYKDTISARLRKPNGRGSWMVHKDCDIEYAKQVTAEQKVNKRMASGAVKQVWELKQTHGDNHWLDCEVYAFAAADILGVRSLHLENQAQQARYSAQIKEPEKTETPEESWIRVNDDWI